MIRIETEIEPPGLPQDEEDDGDTCIGLHVLLLETDGTRRAAYSGIPEAAATAEAIADYLVELIRAVAQLRGPELAEAVRRRLP